VNISDETLMAYVDGELDATSRGEVEAAMAADPEVARRIAEQQRLRNSLRSAFDGVLDETVPEHLIATARTAPVSDLARARVARAEKAERRWSTPVWGAIAASVVLGVLIGAALLRDRGSSPFAERQGHLVAQGDLAEVLSKQLAIERPARDVRIGLTFRDRDGAYCRSFRTPGLGGLACREGDDWAVRILERTEAGLPEGDHEMAGSALPPSVLKAVEDRIAGQPLDAAAEAEARRNGWH
jgi:anti-sigma-K factor RskA